MRFTFWAVLGVVGLIAGMIIWRDQRRADKHQAWVRDYDRRQWQRGIEQSAVRQWPVQKRHNEQGWANRARCRADQETERPRRIVAMGRHL